VENKKSLDFHFQEALIHIEKAIDQSIESVLSNEVSAQQIGQRWETFISQFLYYVRIKGKEKGINFFKWINIRRIFN